MEFKGLKIDFMALAAAITAIAALWTAVKGAKNKEKKRVEKENESGP